MELFAKIFKLLIIFAKIFSTDVCLVSECASKNLLCREQAAPPNTMYYGMTVISQLPKFTLYRLCYAIYMPVVPVQWAYQHQLTMHICWQLERQLTWQRTTVGKWYFNCPQDTKEVICWTWKGMNRIIWKNWIWIKTAVYALVKLFLKSGHVHHFLIFQ